MCKHRAVNFTLISIFIFCLAFPVSGQESIAIYKESIKAYENKDYKKASERFKKLTVREGLKLPDEMLYNGASIFALNNEAKPSFKLLNYLATAKLYSDFNHISKDSDLNNLHSLPEWKTLLKKVSENKRNQPARTRKKIKVALLKAKDILQKDNGKLWGKNIWNDNILVQDYENTIYSLKKLPGSTTKDSILYFKKIPKNTLSMTNTVQKYEGTQYATVLSNYMSDESSTIIHELFHLKQFENIDLIGNPVPYLDNYDAREWLRLEYQALRNALGAINEKKENSIAETFIKDAFLFRKIRQTKYKEFLKGEVEIETLEGLANYTGFVLSTHPNKYLKAIAEIDGREAASTYTRPFPYATGPAYGLIFDFLKLDWKIGLDKVYNFLDIYESKHLKTPLAFSKAMIAEANKRNNYDAIHREELDRKIIFEKRIKYYTELLINKPTLQVTLTNNEYAMSFNMNGTLVLKDKGIVYSGIKGRDLDGSNFGNFVIDPEKAKLGVTGVLRSSESKKTTYIFPLPIKIEGRKIVGESYSIELNNGWEVRVKNKKGDLEIVKKRTKASN